MQKPGLATATASISIETLKTIAMFCGVGLTASLLLASYGLDLSAGFF
jgi:Na+/H+ antiporter NhaA